MFDKVDKLNSDLMECYLDLDSERDIDSDDLQCHIKDLQRQLRDANHEIDSLYGMFGSLFRLVFFIIGLFVSIGLTRILPEYTTRARRYD